MPVKVDMRCDMHSSIISGKCCPCQCILRIDKAVRNNKFQWWPSDSSYLYPAALQCESVKKALLTNQSVFPKDLILDVPSFTSPCSSQCSDPGGQLIDAAQKYKHTFGGPRIQSNGELNSSARKRPKKKNREGARHALSSDDEEHMNHHAHSLPPVYYSGNNFVKDLPAECLSQTMTPIFSAEATGSIFYGDEQSKFIQHTSDRVMTVHDWSKRRNKIRQHCKLVTLSGVSRSATGEEYVCVFHNVALVCDAKDNDNKRQCLVLSKKQLADSDVKFADVDNEDNVSGCITSVNSKDVIFPTLELRKGVDGFDSLKKVVFLSDRFVPKPTLKSIR